jgi:hypothetical protein
MPSKLCRASTVTTGSPKSLLATPWSVSAETASLLAPGMVTATLPPPVVVALLEPARAPPIVI